MEVSVLASGSSGNCFYIGNEKSAVLIDAGISAKKVLEKLLNVGGNARKIKGIFITHEHTDHIRGADVLARKLNVPIFATKATIKNGFLCSDKNLIKIINKNSKTKIGDFRVEAFSKSHSAADPVSYNIYEKKKISVITDVGYACDNIKAHVSDCDLLCIETNHDEMMLENGPYPQFLKKWISSNKGHLSNMQAGLCALEYASPKLKRIILSHLSKTNNTPEMALKTFSDIIRERINFYPIINVSIREEPTELFKI